MGRFLTSRRLTWTPLQADSSVLVHPCINHTPASGGLKKHSVWNAFSWKICGPGDTDQTDGIYLVIPHSGKLPVAYKGLAVHLIGFVVWADGDNSIKTLGERD